MTSKIMPAPIAKKIPYIFEIHGNHIEDNYAWLRDKNWPESVNNDDILTYIKEENAYFEHHMKPLDDLKDQLFEELKGRIKLDDQSTYTKKDDFFYYTRMEKDKDYTIYCRKKGSTNSHEEILLDVNLLSHGKKFTSLGSFSISPDHKLLAFSVDHSGGEKYQIKIFNLETQSYLEDVIENTIGSIVWHENGQGFFYSPVSENWRHDTIKFHNLGQTSNQDKTIFHEPNHLYNVSVSKSSSKKYIFIDVSGHDNNEVYYIKMDDDKFLPKLFRPREESVIYSVDHGQNFFYMHTNKEATNFCIKRASEDLLSWEIFTPQNKEQYLASFDLTQNYLLLNYKNLGLPRLVVYDLTNGVQKDIKFPDTAFTASIYSTNFSEDDIRINYASFTRPGNVYSYEFNSEKLDLLKAQEIPSGLDPEEYHIERFFVDSSDNASVPVSLFYKKTLFKKDGTTPLYLYGYGSYGIPIPPSFRNSAISLVNRGFVFAIAHIRGGSDLGYKWYEDAKFLHKKRTFEDFLAVSEALIEQKYTNKGNITIAGGSAGGMLIGNVINQKPELYKTAIAHVPFVDVLNTMLDENLPLTPGEFKEWGNPKDLDYFEYIKSYSPYENVKNQHYPSIFVTAGLTDPRVGYWEAAKWVAALRAMKKDNNLILYKTNMDFGHKGASGRFDYLKETAEELAFIISQHS